MNVVLNKTHFCVKRRYFLTQSTNFVEVLFILSIQSSPLSRKNTLGKHVNLKLKH